MRTIDSLESESTQAALLRCLRGEALGQMPAEQLTSVFGLAESMGLGPTLARAVLALDLELPAGPRQEMQTALRNNTARNMNIIAGLDVAIAALSAKDVPVIALKGIQLAIEVYPQLGERVLGDLDLLVPREKMLPALQVIESIGYRPVRPYDLRQEMDLHRHIPPYSKPGMPLLEIHWHVLPRRLAAVELLGPMWERARSLQVGSSRCLGLCPADLLLHLCAHASFGQYQFALKYLVDIKLAIEKYEREIDWPGLAERAREWGVANSVYLSLRLSHDLLDGGPATELVELLRPTGYTDGILAGARARIFNASFAHPILTSAQASGNLAQLSRRIWKKLAVPPKHLASLYGLKPESPVAVIFYPVRLMELLALHGPPFLRAMFGGGREGSSLTADGRLAEYLGWLGEGDGEAGD